MFDCGEGTQRQILETTIKPRKVKKSLYHTYAWRPYLWPTWFLG